MPRSPRGLAFALALCGSLLGCADANAPTTPGGPAELRALSVGPIAMTPPFSPDTHDYALPCGPGVNALTFTVTPAPGAQASFRGPTSAAIDAGAPTSLNVPEDSAVVIDVVGGGGATSEYWIRCLPHDFPALTVTRYASTNPGYYVLGNLLPASGETGYAMVLDARGTPVWYRRRGDSNAGWVSVVGHDRIAYSNLFGYFFGIDPNGTFAIEDLDAPAVQTLRPVGGPADAHELVPLGDDRYLLFTYRIRDGVDLSKFGTTDTSYADCSIQEIEADGQVGFEWTASDHVDMFTESTLQPQMTISGKNVRDVFHCNSIDPQPNGDLLVSMRHTDSLFMISRATGKVLWKLGGTPTNKDGAQILRLLDDPEGAFHNQHDARVLPDGHVTLFDDHSSENAPARGLELALDFTASTAKIVWSYAAKPPYVNSLATGSFRAYPTGERVIGWGILGSTSPTPAMTEVDALGDVLMEIGFTNGSHTYRVVKVGLDALDLEVLRKSAGAVAP